MPKPCQSCPFGFTEESDVANNSGCLPGAYEIVQMKTETGNNWACHSNCNRVCQGMVESAHYFPDGKGLDFTQGVLIHDFENVHSRSEYKG